MQYVYHDTDLNTYWFNLDLLFEDEEDDNDEKEEWKVLISNLLC